MLEIRLMGFPLPTFLLIFLIFIISKICCDSTIQNRISFTTNGNINASSSSIIPQTDDSLMNLRNNDSVKWTNKHEQLLDRQSVRHFMRTESLIKTKRKYHGNQLTTVLIDSGQSAYSRIKRTDPSRKDCVQPTLDVNLGTHLSSNEPNFTINAPKIELAHKLFDTNYGLVEGISYTVHISLPMPGLITDICIVITSDDDSYIGMFESKIKQSFISESKQVTDDCIQKIWCAKPAADAKNMLVQWSFTRTESIQRTITFKTLYIPRSTQTIYEATVTYVQQNACELYIKGVNGTIDQTMLPAKIHDECTIIFPTRDYPISSESPGLLIEIKRLNVPCDSNSYVQIANQKKVCGKIEDIPLNNRISYFPLQRNTTIYVIKNPTFELQYEFVDYCHNITLSSRNDSILIGPKQKIKCYFRVHVPYGNRIELRLIQNASDESSLAPPIHQNYDIDLERSDYTIESNMCSGMEIIVEDLISSNKWHYCSTNTDNRSKMFTFSSSSNSIAIRLLTLDSVDAKHVVNEEPILLEYFSIPMPQIVSECAFGWIKMNQFCVSLSSIKLTWEQSELFCKNRGGHLASIKSEKEQEIIDNLLKNSLYPEESNSFWIGASDHIYEGDFRWTDGFPYTYSNWFAGWPNYNNYNKQPNDDGLSEQDCVELRRDFEIPFKFRQITGTSMTSSLYKWNDRGCKEENYFLCERPIADGLIKQPWINDCNKTIVFSRHYSRDYIWSPGYPKSYPDGTNCFTVIIAPKDYFVVIEFEAFLLENEPQCSYDYLELIDSPHYINRTNTNVELLEPNLYNDNNGSHNRSYIFEVFLEIYKNHQNYSILTPFMENTGIKKMDSYLPQRICGNWNAKLKLLRYQSQGPILGLHFSSDYSHHFAGYKAKVSIKSALSQCSDDRLKPFNGMCYLFATYPELNWYTARKVCSSMNADLTSINSIEEQTFIISNIRNDLNFSPQTIYWLGGKYDFDSHNPRFGWSDGKNVTYQGWLQHQSAKAEDSKEKSCLSLQWRTSAISMLPSGLFETFDSCIKSGGYICKMNNNSYNGVLTLNRTFAGYEGTIQSPNFPNLYPTNVDLWINLIGPANTRLVIHFEKIDLEEQQECLYDYVSIQDDISLTGSNEHLTNAKIDENKSDNVPRPFKNEKIIQTSTMNRTNLEYPTFLPYVRLCGTHDAKMFRFDFVSRINRARIKFHSDYSVSRSGFSLKWKAISMDACPSKTYIVNEQFTTITSPNFPNFLLNNLNCTYVLSARAKQRIWIEFQVFHIVNDANIDIDLGHGFFVPFKNKKQLNDGVFVSYHDRATIHLSTGNSPTGSGFKFFFKLITEREEHSLILSSGANGILRYLNHPQSLPYNVEFTQHVIAPLGEVISLEFYNVNLSETSCDIEVYDNYADVNGSFWNLCEISPFKMNISNETVISAPRSIRILSYLNTIHIRQKRTGTSLLQLNATIRIQPDLNYKYKLASGGDEVESCHPNPCRNNGRCDSNGNSNRCRCIGHYVGRFCALTMCEIQPCMFGSCELSPTSFKCNCLHGYRGRICNLKQKPCDENPCENRGVCLEKNGRFLCRCHAWWEGTRCENKITHIPYKPLSKRMLKEPFWLGLITVSAVLSFIGFVWCAKRHFPEKIEKLLVENSDSNRLQGSQRLHTHYHPSLREQLNFTATTNSAPQSTATTPGAARLFGRMGLRKPSILSLSSTQVHAGNARTASLDDLMRSPTQRTSFSARKTRKNSASIKTKTSTEKRLIIETLIAPATINTNARTESINNLKSTNLPFLLPMELPSRPSSVPPTPNESRSLHGASSNRGSNLYSGSELTMNELFVNRRMKSKFSSADSILTMLRNFTSMNVISQLPSSLMISPSTTPSASSQHDESPPWRDCDNVSLSSSMNTPLSQCASETSVPYSMPSISIDDTMDSTNSYKSSSNTSINSTMNATTILLEVPTNANKCLSPIRELPTPVPSPALTPIMSRSIPQRFTGYSQSLFIDKSFPKNEGAASARVPPKIDLDVAGEFKAKDEKNDSAQNKTDNGKSFADNNADRSPKSPSRPTNLVIPQLIVQQSSPTKDCIPFYVHGSPPPKRSNIGNVHIFVTSATPDVNDDKLRAFELIMAEEGSSITTDPSFSKKKE